MNQVLSIAFGVAGFVLVIDLVTTYLRKRARSKSVTPEPPLTEEQPGGEPNEGVAIEYE